LAAAQEALAAAAVEVQEAVDRGVLQLDLSLAEEAVLLDKEIMVAADLALLVAQTVLLAEAEELVALVKTELIFREATEGQG
jgi:hypothetical protein